MKRDRRAALIHLVIMFCPADRISGRGGNAVI